MFYTQQPQNQLDRYITLLQKVGALSNLFSDSDVPALYYRAAENIFCKAFQANNHSRSDTSADASKNKLGIGLKTFLNNNGRTFQKVAEFNKDRKEYIQHRDEPEQLVKKVSELKNLRIDFAKSAHELDDLIYHCVVREKGGFLLFEEPMHCIDLNKISITKISKNSIHFNDKREEYNFNISKSTLLKRFNTPDAFRFDVNILDDPFSFLENLDYGFIQTKKYESVILPFYSMKDERKYVPEKSGLNQWNAGGRTRKKKEVYIKIPLWIHRIYPEFFPSKDQSFNLKLPNGKILSAKICQQGGKALMSNPNTDLGDWLIDKVLKIKPGSIVDYQLLKDLNIDSVEIRRTDESNFEIDFKTISSYEEFKNESQKNYNQ